jgi:trehalose/maltose hydrolase-like predicted phosphorylase
VFRISDDELFASHIKAWKDFWSELKIDADGDDELVKISFFTSDKFAVK